MNAPRPMRSLNPKTERRVRVRMAFCTGEYRGQEGVATLRIHDEWHSDRKKHPVFELTNLTPGKLRLLGLQVATLLKAHEKAGADFVSDVRSKL